MCKEPARFLAPILLTHGSVKLLRSIRCERFRNSEGPSRIRDHDPWSPILQVFRGLELTVEPYGTGEQQLERAVWQKRSDFQSRRFANCQELLRCDIVE